jgi:hypothetical protein
LTARQAPVEVFSTTTGLVETFFATELFKVFDDHDCNGRFTSYYRLRYTLEFANCTPAALMCQPR